MEVSIIVAVYKAENYIRRCLDSIRAQTFTDFEVLLIDDGSPERSGLICDEYAAIDTRFRVFHKENGGVSSARQCGISNARGKYSIHVDPDDWVEPDYLKLLYNKIIEENADICCCNYIVEYGKKSSLVQVKEHGKDKEESLGWFLWNKLVRHELYEKYSVQFNLGLKVGEDIMAISALLSHNLSVVITDTYLYHYNKENNSNSLTSVYNSNRFKFDELFLESLYRMEPTESVVHQRKYHIGAMAHNAFLNDRMSHSEYVRYFKRYFFEIMTSSNPIWRKFNILCEFIGVGCVIRPIFKNLKKFYGR